MKRIYLDHCATTPVHPDVLEAMLPYLNNNYGNPSSAHIFGKKAQNAINEAREKVASLIQCAPHEIIFTSGGTESNNLAIRGIVNAHKEKGNQIITSKIEHHSVLNTFQYLETEGFQVTYLPVDQLGVVSSELLKESISYKTILVSIMHANNEIGTIQPIEKISGTLKEIGITFHVDAVQTVGKISVNVTDLRVDLLSLSGHKIYGPKGVGALYVKDGIKLSPIFYGGHQERNIRSGTENVPAIVGLGKACELLKESTIKVKNNIELLRDRLQRLISEKIPNINVNGHPKLKLPHVLSVSIDSVIGEEIVRELDKRGIAISAGSACTSGHIEISHVISALGMQQSRARGTVRFSLGRYNTEKEIDYTAQTLADLVEHIRSMDELEASSRLRGCF
jgi:cysteine desulfurase